MPLLLFPFLSKQSCRSAAEGSALSAPTAAFAEEDRTPPLQRQLHARLPDWPTLDIFLMLQRCYEKYINKACVGVHRTAPAISTPAAGLSTAELTTWAYRVLDCSTQEKHGDTRQAHTSRAAAGRDVSARAAIVAGLQELIAAHQSVLSLLQRPAPSLLAPLSRLHVLCAPSQLAETMDHSCVEATGTVPDSGMEAALEAHLTSTFAQVVGSNLYTISGLLDAAAAGSQQGSSSSRSGSSDSSGVCLSDLLGEASDATTDAFPLSLFFYLIPLVLDLSAAGAAVAAPHVSPSPSLACVLQREGSQVICSLLRFGRYGGELRWVVTQHLLRRLRTLLFTAVVPPAAAAAGVVECHINSSSTSAVEVACDCTDAGIVLWLAEQLQAYCEAQRTGVSSKADSGILISPCVAPALPRPALSLACTLSAASRVREWLEEACVRELLHILTQQLTAALCNSLSDSEAAHAAQPLCTCNDDLYDANGGGGACRGFCGHTAGNRACNTLPSPRFAEYARLLGPARAAFHCSNERHAASPALMAAVTRLEQALLRHGLLE